MKIFVVATRNQDKPAEEFAPLMDPEADYALKLYKEGFVREIYSRTYGKGALIGVEAENEEEAKNSNGGAYPPDMSVLVKARKGGPDYIYSVLLGNKTEGDILIN